MTWLATASSEMAGRSTPLCHGGMLRWGSRDHFDEQVLAPHDLVPITEVTVGAKDGRECEFELHAVTLNAQGLGGKHALLEAQLCAKRVNLVFIQEAKERCGVCHTRQFLRLNTDAARHFGISIWISKAIGVFTANGKHHQATEDDIRVVYEAPRLLVLEIDVGGIRLALFGAHCPHSGQSAEALAFLQHLHQVLKPLRRSHLLVGGIDLK